jgi:aminoglycoside phosphotransferase (APT) family kinase protein
MRPPGPLLAAGRDADIFEYGPGLVLRRSRGGRSIANEARTMEYLHQEGYPVPAVEDVSEDGSELVMERVDGHSMVEVLARAPWTVRRQGAVLADLHLQLHDVPPPNFLAPAPVGEGDRVLHMDLHPLNVMLGPKGPMVIDWANTCLGDPSVDVALAWVLMSAGEVPGGGAKARVLGLGRSLLVNGFISRFDKDQIARLVRDVVAWKVKDPNMSEREIEGMWRVAGRAATRRP